jgi:hypothetical protein
MGDCLSTGLEDIAGHFLDHSGRLLVWFGVLEDCHGRAGGALSQDRRALREIRYI